MNPRAKQLLFKAPYFIVMTVVIVLAAFSPLLLIERMFWEGEMWGASYALGDAYARACFRRGDVRLLELRRNSDYVNTGKKEGEFEIWSWPSYGFDTVHLPFELLERPGKVSAESYVDGWNKAMRRMVHEARTADGNPVS